MPDSNGFQERVFSSCTWFDGKLSNGQKVDMTFQMRFFATRTVIHPELQACINDARKEWAKNRTKDLLKLTASRCEEEDYDSDIDVMVDLYNKIDEPPAQN
ncbi:expressed unknown protein [Seminavis robusta]|uniref:Uncharacterized protein n=1 Tax=Seminavis robusta TaxID=568900 RepID=A0A9N8DC48_9STRA|nr:expressed unknown protein [Seminavis robusta]|eukprot:Sro12_g009571.1  (101) ;mRNA; r:157058-157360